MSIYLTGASGFVGKNVTTYFSNKFEIKRHVRNTDFSISQNIVIHLAGKAHDLKKTSNPQEYYESNTLLTKSIFDKFLKSNAKIFITLSSIKAVADLTKEAITEDTKEEPKTHYGKSKLEADRYILSKPVPKDKRVYILRPCMIHGKGYKGNLYLLYKIIKNKIPWPLGAFNNERSYCSVENLIFVIQELISNPQIPSGIYNIADDQPLSTNDVIKLIGRSKNIRTCIYSIPKIIVKIIAKIGDLTYLPLNSERLQKLTESYVVDNSKIMKALKKPLPVSSTDGLIQTFKSSDENK